MAIYLNKQSREYLRVKLKSIAETDYIGQGILKELTAADHREKEIEECSHEESKYTGEKECCNKCGTLFVPGQSERWTVLNSK